MKVALLVALLASAHTATAVKVGDYECNNHCKTNAKYGKRLGTAQAAGMSGVGVFAAYHGNLY